jgi:DNA polymerase-3 subunit alpha
MFDGFDKINNIVAYAKELGHKAVGLSDHGNACGIIQLYLECKKQGLKPLMGVEAYFQPKFSAGGHKFHLCLYAYNNEGYANLCRIISEANDKNFYRTMTVDFELLEKYTEGIICTSACIAGFLSQAVVKKKTNIAVKAAKRFKKIYGDNFYIELQPMIVEERKTDIQKYVNEKLMGVAEEVGIKTILTSDSHFTRKEDFDSYLMMHRLGKIGAEKGEGFTIEHIEQTYKERYMHSEKEICLKFAKMHGFYPQEQLDAMDEIYDKIDIDLDFSGSIPECDDYDDNEKALTKICQQKLKDTGRWTKEYIDRAKYEISVIKGHGLCDYFLIVREYVQWAKENNIYVGPGRGSCGGSLVTELLGITEIDPIVVGTDFDRFLRPDKKKMPDIDLDFENGRQQEVIEHIITKYQGRASKISTFGYYKSANLINDLCKVYEIPSQEVARIKSILQAHVPEMAHFEFEDIEYEEVMRDRQVAEIDKDYTHFVKHFCMLCGQVKYYGQHPAGVLVTKGDIASWVPMMKVKGMMICSYDKYDCEAMDMVKFDVLALKTLNVLHEIEEATNDRFDRRHIDDDVEYEMYQRFSEGATLGIFQLNKDAARNILRDIKADTIQDVIAAISLNRPGTLKLKTHEQYAANKQNVDDTTVWYPYTKDAHGSIIYQEHVMRICKGLANMPMDRVDKLMKFKFSEEERGHLKEEFMAGAKEHSGLSGKVTGPLFDAMALYMFNKGHGAGYALISEWMMYHKVKHPTEFWFATLKWEYDERKRHKFETEAASEGILLFIPHVNYSSDYSIRTIEGEKIIQMGYNSIKGVGPKAAEEIEAERRKNGPFKSYDDFVDRCKSRAVTSRVIDALLTDGALEFKKKVYIERVKKYNASLYMKGLRK